MEKISTALDSETRIFNNHVILATILNHCDLQTLKSARLVSSYWNQEATPILCSKTHFHIFCDYVGRVSASKLPFPGLPARTPENSIIFRKVKVEVNSSTCDPFDFPFTTSLLSFLETYQDLIEDLNVRSTSLIFPLLVRSFGVLPFPNLRSLTLIDFEGGSDTSRINMDFTKYPLPERKSLKTLHYAYEAGPFIYRGEGRPYHDFVQALIKRSPFLSEISIKDNLFPDLSGLTKLNKLSLRVHRKAINRTLDVIADPTFSCEKVQLMLNEVKDRLSFLSLEEEGQNLVLADNSAIPGRVFNPDGFSCPNLDCLEIRSVTLFPDKLDRWFVPSNFPRLKTLMIRGSMDEVYGYLEYLRSGGTCRMTSVQEVKLHFYGPGAYIYMLHPLVEQAKLKQILQVCFPNLKKVLINK